MLGKLSSGCLAQEAEGRSLFLGLGLFVFWRLSWGHWCKTALAVMVELQAVGHVKVEMFGFFIHQMDLSQAPSVGQAHSQPREMPRHV